MSRRGEVTIECDVQDCHAEIVIAVHDADLVRERCGLSIEVYAGGWKNTGDKDICPQCAEEGKA